MKANTVIGGIIIAIGLDIIMDGFISKAIVDSIGELLKDKELREDIKELITILGKAIEERDKNELGI